MPRLRVREQDILFIVEENGEPKTLDDLFNGLYDLVVRREAAEAPSWFRRRFPRTARRLAMPGMFRVRIWVIRLRAIGQLEPEPEDAPGGRTARRERMRRYRMPAPVETAFQLGS